MSVGRACQRGRHCAGCSLGKRDSLEHDSEIKRREWLVSAAGAVAILANASCRATASAATGTDSAAPPSPPSGSALEETTIANAKRYFARLWPISEEVEAVALSELDSLLSSTSVQKAIVGLTSAHRSLPWER